MLKKEVTALLKAKNLDIVNLFKDSTSFSEQLGAEVLLLIQEKFGDKGILEFADWAIHESSGFLAPSLEFKPLPKHINSVCRELLNQINEQRQELIEEGNCVEKSPETMNRRKFLKIAGFSLGGSVLYGGLAALYSKEAKEERVKNIALASLVGAAVHGSLEYIDEKKRELKDSNIVWTESDPGATPIGMDEVVQAASSALEKAINKSSSLTR